MEIHPTKEEFLGLARNGNVIPVYADLMADFETPVSAYAKLRAHGPAYLLESVEGGERWGDLYLVFADRDYAGPGALRLAQIIRTHVGEQCRKLEHEAVQAAGDSLPVPEPTAQ